MIVYARQTKGRGIERRGALAIRTERLAIKVQLGVEFPRSPGRHGLLDVRFRNLQQVNEGAQVRRQAHNCPDIEVAIGPAVEAVPDAGGVGVIDRRMTQRALNANGIERPSVLAEKTSHADNRIGLEQNQRARWILQIDLTLVQCLGHFGGDGVYVDLQPDFERLLGAEAGTNGAQLLAGNRFMEFERSAPKGLATERVETECLSAFIQISLGLLSSRGIVVLAARRFLFLSGGWQESY